MSEETPIKKTEGLDHNLSPNAPAFIPGAGIASEGKKPKKTRTGPRKRRRKKNEGDFLDFDTSDLLERTSQGSNASSTPGGHGGGGSGRRGRERGEKSYVPLYQYGLSPQEGNRFADLTNSNLSRLDENSAGDWLTGIMGGHVGGPQTRFRSGSTNSDATNRSSEWLDMHTEWSLSKQLSGSMRLGGGGAPTPHVMTSPGGMGLSVDSSIGGSLSTGAGVLAYGSPPSSSVSSSSAHEEEKERKRWSDWAISAAEMERCRRIVAMDEIDKAEARERLRRRRWAISAIEAEKNERLSDNFLNNLTSTNWFHEAISSIHNKDYDVVCPYYKLGCRVTCKKSAIEKHVQSCSFGVESSHNSNREVLDEDYEVVCPNSVLGCDYIGGKNDVQVHLSENCAYKGKSRQEEQEERRMMKQFVIGECEEERVRRLTEDEGTVPRRKRVVERAASMSRVEGGSLGLQSEKRVLSSDGVITSPSTDSRPEVVPKSNNKTDKIVEADDKGDDKTLTLHLLMEIEMNKVVAGLHDEALQFWEHWRLLQAQRRPAEVNLIQQLQHCMRQLWDFASLEPFGSWSTGLPGVRSDIDLVVCFEDDILLTKTPTSRNDLLRQLANYLGIHAKNIIKITKVLLHTRVPLIKAHAKVSVPCESSPGGVNEVTVELDISIDGPEHSGLATTSLSLAMLKALPGLGPATMLIKEYLKEKGLCDSYSGGLASYGIFLLVCLLFLRRFHANQLAVDMSQTGDTFEPNVKSSEEIKNEVAKDEKSGEVKVVPLTSNVLTSSSLSGVAGNDRDRASPRGTLDKSFSKDASFSESHSLSPPPHRMTNNETRESAAKSTDQVSDLSQVQHSELTRTTSDPHSYSFINVKQQREYGRRVAAKLLLNPSDVDDQEKSLLEIEAFLSAALSDDFSDLSTSSALDPEQPLQAPMLGIIIVEFLGVYGEELQCGRHGFSVRDGGFRFDVQPSMYTVAHPQANDPLLIEDPVNVMNNVAKNCFNALAVQKVFLEAHDRFKNVVTRYSGRAGSALAKGGSVLDKVFGISLSRASGVSIPSSDNISGEPNSPTQTEDMKGSGSAAVDGVSEVLLYRKPSPGTQSTDADIMSTLPKQLLDDIVRSKKSSAGVILGEEFRKVLHEMLLHQQAVVVPTSPDGKVDALQNLQLSVQSSPGRTTHKQGNTTSRSNGIATSPLGSRPSNLNWSSGSNCQFYDNDLILSPSGLPRPPAKKRSSYTTIRKPVPIAVSPPSGKTRKRSESY
mmetsp:Transcript_17019/g.28390  ORF Transcript_17019/g.28390 Transcript_17019/m.28390 type:complete len:1248 (-) Transcript_17019:206-3949(-)